VVLFSSRIRGNEFWEVQVIIKDVDGIPIYERTLDDKRVLNVYPLTFGRARLGISKPEPYSMGGYEDVW